MIKIVAILKILNYETSLPTVIFLVLFASELNLDLKLRSWNRHFHKSSPIVSPFPDSPLCFWQFYHICGIKKTLTIFLCNNIKLRAPQSRQLYGKLYAKKFLELALIERRPAVRRHEPHWSTGA